MKLSKLVQYPNDVASFYPRKIPIIPQHRETRKERGTPVHRPPISVNYRHRSDVSSLAQNKTTTTVTKRQRERKSVDSDGDALNSDVRFRSAAPRVSNRRSISGIFDPRRKGSIHVPGRELTFYRHDESRARTGAYNQARLIAKDASHRNVNVVFPEIARADLRATGRNSSNVESGKNRLERYRFNGPISRCDNDLENDGENGFDGRERSSKFENITKMRISVDLED